MNLSRILSSLFVPRKSAFKKCGVAAFWLLATLGRTAGASEPLRVTISVPLAEGAYRASTGAKDHSIVYVDAKATCFYILVTNVSENTQRIWMDGIPWGYDDLMFELTAEKGEKVAVIKPLTGFTMSVPAWWILAAGETHVFAIYFADPEEWVGFPLLPAGSQQVYTMRAFYKSNESPESKQYGIWHGEIASDSIRVSFYNASRSND